MKTLLFLLLFPLASRCQVKEYLVEMELDKANKNAKGFKYKIDSIKKTDDKWVVYYKYSRKRVSLFIGPDKKLIWSKTVCVRQTKN